MSLEHSPAKLQRNSPPKQRKRTKQSELPARGRIRIRRHELANIYKVHVRTIDWWSKHDVIPPPHYLPGSRIPLWYRDETVDREQAEAVS